MEVTLVDRILGSGIPYITYSVPLFFILIFIEMGVARLQGRTLYRFADSITDLSCGIMQQMTGLFVKFLTLGAYVWIYDHYAVMDVASLSPAGKGAAALGLFLGVDFCYYWFHRASHEVNFLWAAHVVHHHSEEYNLAVALRQSTFQGWFSWLSYLPLALLGFPPLWFAAMSAFSLLYQFWIHTRAIGHMGPLEWVLNTPSHHRVHHGKNPQYIDRNHAGTLIIWDRMFGTFEPEGEAVVYGTTRELRSWNPLWSNFQEWVDLYRDSQRFPRWQDRIKVWFMEPGWLPEGVASSVKPMTATAETQVKYDTPLTAPLVLYVLGHFILCVGAGVAVLVISPTAGVLGLTPVVLWVLWTLTALGGVLEGRSWARKQEPLRLVAGALCLGAYLTGSALMIPAVLAAVVVAAGSTAALPRLWRRAAPQAARA